MATDSVRVSEQTTVTDSYGNRTHYEVAFERRQAVGDNIRAERVALTIRSNGIERLNVELPGEVGLALFWTVRQAFEKFDVENMVGRKVSL